MTPPLLEIYHIMSDLFKTSLSLDKLPPPVGILSIFALLYFLRDTKLDSN